MSDIISRQAAIELIERMKSFHQDADDILEMMDNMPSAEPQWIPISERLPEDDTEVIVSCTDDSGDSEFSYTTTGWHFKGMWVVGNERSYFVRAWMPLPEPYEGDKE